MTFDKEKAYKIYEQETGIAKAARDYCEKIGIEYEERYRHQLSRYISTLSVSTDTETETYQYSNDNEAEPIMPSAWDETLEKFLSIDEYCDKYGLPKELVRSSKLVAHQSSHMSYNIAFNSSTPDVEGFDTEFISEVVKSYLKPRKPTKKSKVDSTTADRLIMTDVHIGMSTEGGRNVTPLYDNSWNSEQLTKRKEELIDFILTNKSSNDLYIDELGDFTDGFNGQTSRGGHTLPQNMSDREMFREGVDFKIELLDALSAYYDSITMNCVNESNHSPFVDQLVNDTVKRISDYIFDNVKVNLLDKFIEHYTIGVHTIICCHGKDSTSLKFGFKPVLDLKASEKIDQYCKENKLYNGNLIEFSKGDSHQCILDFTSSNDFQYMNYPAFSPPSNWVKTNFKNTKSGFVFQKLDLNSHRKTITPYFFE